MNAKKKLDVDIEREIKHIIRKYEIKCLPVYSKVNEIIQGHRIPNDEELRNIDSYLKEDEQG